MSVHSYSTNEKFDSGKETDTAGAGLAINGPATASYRPARVDTTLRLIHPENRSQVFTFTPEFSWNPFRDDAQIDYRLIISDNTGKILFSEWIGNDTRFVLPDSNRLNDLNTYYWTVYAQSDSEQFQSPVWSFWIDQEIGTDLVVKDILLMNPKEDWNAGDTVQVQAIVENSGPKDAGQCFVKLFSGNVNRNYFDYSAARKTLLIDTASIDSLVVNEPKTIVLSGRIPYGFNNFYVTIEPGAGTEEIIDLNNDRAGIQLQTENRVVSLDGLFVFYHNYQHPEIGEKRLSNSDTEKIFENIIELQQYFWNHTQILDIDLDTLHVNRFLKGDDFTFQDSQWGYFLAPDRVMADLKMRFQTNLEYDFIFVFYSWWNTPAYWSGYSGYTFKAYKINDKPIAFLAQPQYQDQIATGEVTIHEFIHFLDHLFQASDERTFYSPHQRTVFTTFDNDPDYFDWILETLPSDRWFNLKQGKFLSRREITRSKAAAQDQDFPNDFVLLQNEPNPFNKTTTIEYKIPPLTVSMLDGAYVRLCLYDLLGNRINCLVNTQQGAGFYRVSWDGTDQSGKFVKRGIYLCELKIGEKRQVRKILYFQ